MSHLTYHQIQAMADGTIGGSDRRVLQEHVSSCKHCTKEIALQQSMVEAIRQAPVVKPSRRFTRNVMEQILPGSQESGLFKFLGGTGKILAMTLVIAVIAFALTRTWPETAVGAQSQQNQSEVSKLVSQYYAQAQQLLLQGSGKMGQTMAQQSKSQQSKILTMTLLSLIGLLLLDRYVFRPLLKMKL